MTLSDEQERVAAHIQAGGNALITGSAGTGKSTLLRELTSRFEGNLPVCASTGIAAVNVGGMTVHSWAGLGLGDDPAEVIAGNLTERKSGAWRRIRTAKRLAIDEVSMIHGELFELIDRVFRLVRENDAPFGGIQMILFGDFLQLPPVSKGREQRFAFQSDAWVSAGIRTFVLSKVFRQADAAFSAALNDIRLGNVTDAVKAMLTSRYRVADAAPEIEPVTVYTHNADVEAMNERRLAQIKGEAHEWRARDYGEPGPLKTLQKNCLAPETLRLKVGAQVMCLWNIDPEAGIANGSIGTVEGFGKHTKLPRVKFASGAVIEMEKRQWQIKSGSDILAERSQLPLRLAWAITVHKSQGMTLDKIRVHLAKAFEHGQSYVALSRARTLDGLFIESTSPGCIKAHPAAVAFYGH